MFFSVRSLFEKKSGVACAGRESNPGLVRGRDVYYHCTTGADASVVSQTFHPLDTVAVIYDGTRVRTALQQKLWRNGSALDSRPKGWGFESL